MVRERTVRQKRVADQLQMVIGDLLLRRMNDPRLDLVTVTTVNVDSELEFANVWVCAAECNEKRRAEVMKVLDHARGFIRHEVAARINLRRTPKLIFHWDFAPDHAARIDELINAWKPPLSFPTSTGTSDDNTP